MKALVFFVFIFATVSTAYSQNNFIVWDDKKPLDWTDFSGPVNDTSNYDAESFAEVRFSYTFNSLTDFTFDVNATFNKNTSWYRKESESPSLLKHEQLHFNIAELFAKKLKSRFENYSYSENFKEEIAQIFESTKKQYHQLQDKYDDETNHSLNTVMQRQWELAVNNELKKMQQEESRRANERMLAQNQKPE